jgi:pyridoxal phosphate enzyme (YggS family)
VTIAQNIARLVQELPPGVRLLAAAKSRTPAEVKEAVAAGISIIGENYVQEAETARPAIEAGIEWHFIGHLQKNKVKKAVELFDLFETVDCLALARDIDKRCSLIGRTMPVLIEINSGREPQKSGVFPENAEALIREIASLVNIRIMGLMTMGPFTRSPEDLRPCFAATRQLFERFKELKIPGVTMEYLSMGMTDSYRVAVEEGANLVRIGSKIFGERSYQ